MVEIAQKTPREKHYLKDYVAPSVKVESLDLVFELDPQVTRVSATMVLHPETKGPLVLNGERLTLQSIKKDGHLLDSNDFEVTHDALTIPHNGKKTTLEIIVEISPKDNGALSGLYESRSILCTQCESHGFRRITYFFDRPDVLTSFTTKIIADKNTYPVLLSNGDCVEEGKLDNNLHYAVWKDPFKKPCYLFALVAGNLAHLETYYETMSGKDVTLRIYSEKKNIHYCEYALTSLKKAMQWDEETYQREYDLSTYMIVAVDDFNYGAMENKGLNIFNAKYILANPAIATDHDYRMIDTVVGHEYFHNWSGDRVTCRDWFQLSLKEGFTVFREQCFDESLTSQTIGRITQVKNLRAHQFPEDRSPLSHPVQPDAYLAIDNFYTATIYEKGAEVIRMMKVILGEKQFYKGTSLYFTRHDGEAVTIHDFVKAMQDASGVDLTQFMRWYKQNGTPKVTILRRMEGNDLILEITQSLAEHIKDKTHFPLLIPIKYRLYDKQGKRIAVDKNDVLLLSKEQQSFRFEGVGKAIPSMFCGFSAPVEYTIPYTDEELALLVESDEDGFNRWESMQQWHQREFDRLVSAKREKAKCEVSPFYLSLIRKIATTGHSDKLLYAELLLLPSITTLVASYNKIPVDEACEVHQLMQHAIAKNIEDELVTLYEKQLSNEPYVYDMRQASSRQLKNVALQYLVGFNPKQYGKLATYQFEHSFNTNMNDVMGALEAIREWDGKERENVSQRFFDHFKREPIAFNKWLSWQARCQRNDLVAHLRSIMQDDIFDIKNPNNLHSLIGGFSQGNFKMFHANDGSGYAFLKEAVLKIDRFNPQVSGRLAKPLTMWRNLDPKRQSHMKQCLQEMADSKDLSQNLIEIVTDSL